MIKIWDYIMSSSFCSTQSTSRFSHSSTSLVFNLWRMVLLLMVLLKSHAWAVGNQQVPCYFIFGDSLADNGNNNFLSTSAKVNYQPYGIDFHYGPTGRFSNGRTTADIIAELLGFDNYIPAFSSARGTDILIGVNYASGSAGICNETGQHLGDRICLNKQLQNHKITVEQMANILGNNESAARYLTKCLYSVGMGSNDYINNYFFPEHYPVSREYTPEQYARVLIEQYSQQLRYWSTENCPIWTRTYRLHSNAINSYGTNGSYCVDQMNYASKLFNIKLKSLVNRLNIDLADAKFIYIGSHRKGEVNSSVTGFKVPNSPCCQVTDIGQCIPNRIPCQNRNEYKFWDAFHPTEAANILTAVTTYSTLKSSDVYAFPILHSSSLNQGAAAA